MKRAFSVLLVALLILGAFSACATTGGEASSQSSAQSSQPASSTSAAAVEKEPVPEAVKGKLTNLDTSPITLTAFLDYPDITNGDLVWGKDYTTQAVTEKSGVTIELRNATTNDHQELNTLLASGAELPDFLVTQPFGPMPQVLISQGFVEPLNKLADEFYPEFWNVLPYQEDMVNMVADGNFYYVVDQFGDMSRFDELKEGFSPNASFLINVEMLAEIGNPSIKTLEDLREALKLAKDKLGISFPVFDGNPSNAQNENNMAQLINRLMGGGNLYSNQPDDTIKLNFQDQAYKDTLKYMNDLYRDKTLNPEVFTYNPQQPEMLKQLLENKQVFAYFGHNWQVLGGYEGGFEADAPMRHADYPISSKISPSDVKLNNSYASVGANTAMFISVDSKNKSRAIQYVAWLLSDEGQIVLREGKEGVTFNFDAEGIPNPTEIRTTTPAEKRASELGYAHPQTSWVGSGWVLALARHLRVINEPYYGAQLDTAKPYKSWERLNILSGIITDPDLQAVRAQIFDTWNNALPQICLANTDEEFEAAYQKLINDCKQLGLDRLEEQYTKNYKEFKARGIE